MVREDHGMRPVSVVREMDLRLEVLGEDEVDAGR